MDKEVKNLTIKNDKTAITMAIMIILELGKQEVLNREYDTLLSDLKESTNNLVSDNYRERVINIAREIATYDNNQLREIMNYVSKQKNNDIEKA